MNESFAHRFKNYSHRAPKSVEKFRDENGYLVIPSLQIYAADHCTQRCQFCTTSSPHRKAHQGDVDAFVKYINKMHDRHVKFDAVNILGGEPFLHKNLADFVHRLRAGMAYRARFVITTNGFWLGEMDDYPSGLEAGDGITFSRYADVIHDVGGVDRYNSLIEKLKRTRPENIDTNDAFHFREWQFTEEPMYGFPLDCELADNVSLADTGEVHRCCVAPASRFSPRVTKAFLDRVDELEYRIDADEGLSLKDWLRSPLPDACAYCTAHHETPYYPLRSLSVIGKQFTFSGDENLSMLSSGFSRPEPGGVWTVGSEAVMSFADLPEGRSRSPYVTFIFMATPHLTALVPDMKVTVEILGTEWKEFWSVPPKSPKAFFGNTTMHALFVPNEIARCAKPLQLKFTIDRPHSPAEAGTSTDPRELGLFFQYVLVEL
ncbi:radical SAM protein [Rhodopseudomonas sp. NSM]|uniref:radical SAM protein n=1 Tax=Rhodopseudomonas sp. NSM TaxID=3457630 RepID=UPI004034FCF9